MPQAIDVLIPTFQRPAALAATLTSLWAQTFTDFRVVVSDQGDDPVSIDMGEIRAVARLLEASGRPVELLRHLPRRGLAEQRQFLLDRSDAPHVFFLDDDVILEPGLMARLEATLSAERRGFVGSGLTGLSYLDDVRPEQQAIEFWDSPVAPERVEPGSPQWQRHRLHSAANLLHVQRRLGVRAHSQRLYKVAWVGGCVLYDRDKLIAAGGFEFWRDLPEQHCGEDVLAQLRLLARDGGCGLLPSGAYHQEIPTTVADRRVDAPRELGL